MSQHRPALINPDTRAALTVALLATAALVAISFTLSYAGLSALAPWAAVPLTLAPLIPLFIDGAIGVYTYSALAARARGESAARPWTWVALWTLVSSAANAAHAWGHGPQGWEGLVGATLAGLFPIGSLLGTHEIAARMIGRPAEVAAALPAVPAPLHLVPNHLDKVRAHVNTNREPVRRTARRALSAALRQQVLAHRADGLSGHKIARKLGIGKTAVYDILKEQSA